MKTKAIRCDKCGCVFESDYHIKLSLHKIDNTEYPSCRDRLKALFKGLRYLAAYDLCEDCSNEIIELLNRRKNEN